MPKDEDKNPDQDAVMRAVVEHGEGRIYGNKDSGHTISFRSQWMPGIYDSLESAIAALDYVSTGNEFELRAYWQAVKNKTEYRISLADIRRIQRMRLGL